MLGLNEIENTPGVDPLGDPTRGIVPGLNALLGAGTYAAINTGTIGTDAIKVGLIYKPAKVTPVGAFQILDSTDDPRFIDTRSRPVLAQTFQVIATGARFTVAVNHLKSKGSACAGDPDTGDGAGNCNLTRKAAAAGARRLARHRPDGQRRSGLPDHRRPQLVRDGGSDRRDQGRPRRHAGHGRRLHEPRRLHLGTYAYSYVFDGQAGYLDHALGELDA